ncbi:MAG: response regulator [Deltaproteobacteria bacterium]|nr:response regulator [Deltaproteobacteria bacterium]
MKKILLVDDEVALTRMMKLVLERTGKFEVHTENSGTKAVAAVREFQPDMIFLDIMMPEMSGDAIAQELREDNELADIPVVFLTAIVSKQETATLGSVIGGNRFLAKPVKAEDLIKVIEELT